MTIRQLSTLQHTNNDDLGNKTSIEIVDEKFILRFRWSVIPKRNKFLVDVLLLDGGWHNLLVVVEKKIINSEFQFFNEYNTTLPEWSVKTMEMVEKVSTEIEVLKSKKCL